MMIQQHWHIEDGKWGLATDVEVRTKAHPGIGAFCTAALTLDRHNEVAFLVSRDACDDFADKLEELARRFRGAVREMRDAEALRALEVA